MLDYLQKIKVFFTSYAIRYIDNCEIEMNSIYTFKKEHNNFKEYEELYIAAAAIKYICEKNLLIGLDKLLFLGLQALNIICQCNLLIGFKEYMRGLDVSKHAYI